MLQGVTIEGERRGGAKNLAVIAFVAAVSSTALGFLFGVRWLLPALNALSIYPFYLELVLGRQRRRAVMLVLLWAVFLTQATIAATYFFPERAEAVVIRGAEYRAEMFEWIATGEGKESTPRMFVPEHLRDFGLFALLGVATGGLGALYLGALLLNFMNYYVGALVAASLNPVWTLFLAWQPYAIIRVIGYIVFATALTEASFGVMTRFAARWHRVARYTATGLALVALDIVVKVYTAALWARVLRWASGFGQTLS